jgi:hypothetical protein
MGGHADTELGRAECSIEKGTGANAEYRRAEFGTQLELGRGNHVSRDLDLMRWSKD